MNRAETLCFTGHRPDKLGGYNPNNPLRRKLRIALAWKMWAAYELGFRTYISGMAQGLDQDAAELVVRLRTKCPDVRLVAAVPHENQPRPWPLPAQRHYRELLAQADEVQVVFAGEGFFNWMLQKRNEWMVDRSCLVLAAWDGSRGGTYNCMQYAYSRGAEVWTIDLRQLTEEVPF